MKRVKANHDGWIRISLIYSAFLLGAAILAAHLFFLQFDPEVSSYYRAVVAQRWESFEYPQGKRGNILFCDGAVIASNRKVARVLVDPVLVRDVAGVAEVLSPLLNAPPEQIARSIEEHEGRGAEVARSVPLTTALAIDNENLRGVFTFYYYERFYPLGPYGAASTVGYAGPQPVHRTGLEYTWNEHLTGRDGAIHFRKDARRKRLPGSEISIDEKEDGADLTTTLDQGIQLIAEDELARAVAGNNADWACVLVLDPEFGEVRAAATHPTFDPNEYAKGNIGDEYNVIVHRVIEPGSTVKPLLAACSIERNWLDPARRFVCNRQLLVDGKPLREAEASHLLGDSGGVPVRDIIVHSSNIGMAQVALALGQDRVLESYRAMGFFARTGIELPAECEGLAPCYYMRADGEQRVQWPRRVLATAGFGQGMSITPLQLARAYCVIANGGYMVQPTLVAGQQGARPAEDAAQSEQQPPLPAGEVILAGLQPVPGDGTGNPPAACDTGSRSAAAGRVRVLSPQTCELISGWLSEVVESGTGKKARLARHRAAGKTGTGQIPSEQGGYRRGAYTATFAGFFPAEAPRYVVLVLFVNPKGGKYYGGEVAAPVFKSVCDRISYLDYQVPAEVPDAA